MSSSHAADSRPGRASLAQSGEAVGGVGHPDDEGVSATRRRADAELGTIAGRYKLLSRIAEGGMGVVYKAEHVLSRKKLAIKILHPHLCHGRQAVERFRREVSAAAEIDHPGIVQVFDAGVDTDGSFYMAMELLEGESLGNRTRHEWPGTRTTVDLIVAMCGPLARAHEKGFVHRDLKPDNVFIARDHTGQETVKLLDFGLVREVTRRGPTMSGITFGTPEYMAPEQAMSAKKAGVQADVWSVGVMLYELLAGRHPFTGETANAVMANAIKEPHPPLAEVAPHVPPELARIVERCLEKDPARRPRDAGELAALLVDLRQRVALDDRAPEDPVLRSQLDEEEEGEAELGSDEEQALLTPAPPLPIELQSATRTEQGLPGAGAGRLSYGAWAGVMLASAGLLGVIAWALSHREAATMVATSLAGTEAEVGAPGAGGGVAAPSSGEAVAAHGAVSPTSAAPDEGALGAEAEPGALAAEPGAAAGLGEGAPGTEAVPSELGPGEVGAGAQAAIEGLVIEVEGTEANAIAPSRAGRSRRAEQGGGSALAEAQACLQRGDTRCAVSALQNGQSAAEMALLVDVYQMQGRSAEARGVMQRYVRRYPRGRDADAYRRALGLAGQ